jgi:protein-disulfide isomerase
MTFRIVLGLLFFINIYLAYAVFGLWTQQRQMDDAPVSMSIGPMDADVIINGFFDYDCLPCRVANDALMIALAKDGHVRYIPRPLAGETPQSRRKAQLFYAAAQQQKMPAIHAELMKSFRALDAQKEDSIITGNALDAAQFRNNAASPEAQEMMEHHQDLYEFTRQSGVPVFVVSRHLVFVPQAGIPLVDQFTVLFKDARNKRR